MKNIGILGSTGSVGKQTLDVIRNHKDKFNIVFLSAHSNTDLLLKQAIEFKPQFIAVSNDEIKKESIGIFENVKILYGKDGILELCQNNDCDLILNSIVGYSGLEPTLKIINSGIDLALSNKESIVQAGHLVMDLAKKKKVNIFPVDSEHSAIWQCLIGENHNTIKKLILTASGGPFRKTPLNQFPSITKKDALNHPNWSMGNKISIDSATMMNKGFELIEACWLFDIGIDKVEIVVHPQSIIHSMVEFIDGSIKAQLSNPDMRLPIQFALSYPERYHLNNLDFNISNFSKLNFEQVDMKKFKCIKLAYQAIELGDSFPTVLNVSNDLLVDLFLKEVIEFDMIPKYIEEVMNSHERVKNPNIDQIADIINSIKLYIKEKIKI